MRYALFAGLLAVARVSCRSTSNAYHMEHGSDAIEHLRRVPEGWNEIGTPSQDRKLHFRIAVRSVSTRTLNLQISLLTRQENPDLFERTLMEVSTPSHPRYGQHLKREELKNLIKPRVESTNAVLDWLQSSGVASRDIRNDGEWITFYAPVKRAEEMMGTTFKTYQSEIRPTIKKVRSLSYSVPKEVRSHIDMIQPTTRFGQIRPARSNVLTQEAVPFSAAAINATCNYAITPACLADLYKFADYKVDPKADITIGVNGFLEQYARYADFAQFAKSYAPYAVGSNFSFTSVNGA